MTRHFQTAKFGQIAVIPQVQIHHIFEEITPHMPAELRQPDQESPAVFHKTGKFVVVFPNHGIPAEMKQQGVAVEIFRLSLGGNFIEIAVRRAGEEKSAFGVILPQRQSAGARHQHVQQLTAFFRLAMSPKWIVFAEETPHGIIGCLIGVADEPVEGGCVTPFDEGDLPGWSTLARMGFDKAEKFARHIPFAFCHGIVPRLTLLLEELE